MGGFKLVGKEMVIEQGGRMPFTTAGKLLMLLTSEQTFTASLVFPDVPKTEIYGWTWLSDDIPLSSDYAWGATGQSLVGALPQQWSDTIVLGAAPAAANIHMGRAAFTRSAAPSHAWWSYPLDVLVPIAVEMQIAGSFILEQAPGFCRAVSIYIADGTTLLPGPAGSLVAFLQQSVGAGAGNFNAWGDSAPTAGDSAGGTNTSAGGASIPVYANSASPYRKVGSGTGAIGVGPGGVGTQVASYNNGGSNQATYLDPTNYSSTYALTVKTRFGRLNS